MEATSARREQTLGIIGSFALYRSTEGTSIARGTSGHFEQRRVPIWCSHMDTPRPKVTYLGLPGKRSLAVYCGRQIPVMDKRSSCSYRRDSPPYEGPRARVVLHAASEAQRGAGLRC
jgi:hypothetical protein